MIHVCFCFHDKTRRYAKFVGTAMLSLFENTDSKVTVHILHDNTLTQDNHGKFIHLADRYNQQVKFYNAEKLCADKLAEYMKLFSAMKDSRITVAGFYKFLIPQLLSEYTDKIIYLDADIIVNLDIKNLWDIELNDKVIAAVPEIEIASYPSFLLNFYLIKENLVDQNDYFNSGVFMMNLKKSSVEELIINGIKWRGEHQQCWFFDQDIFNYLFAKNYVKLPEKFDVFIDKARKDPKIRPAIYHYVSENLQLYMNDVFNRLWMDYFTKTPWFDANEIIDNMYKYILKLGENNLDKIKKLSAVLSGKTRAFVVTPEQSERVKKEFFVRDDEEIIVVAKNAMNQELIDRIKNERGGKVFFGFVSGFPEALKTAGLVEDKDFFNGSLFSPKIWEMFVLEYGYKIIKEM